MYINKQAGKTRGVWVVTAIEEQLVNSQAPDIAIYFRTYLCAALAFIAAA